MQGHEHSKGMSKSKMGLSVRVARKGYKMGRVGEGRARGVLRTELRHCGWMGYVVGDLGTSSGHGEVLIGVPVQCYMECNTLPGKSLYLL